MDSSSDEDNCAKNLKHKLGSMMEENSGFDKPKISLGLKKHKFPRDESDDEIEERQISDDNLSSSSYTTPNNCNPMGKAKSMFI